MSDNFIPILELHTLPHPNTKTKVCKYNKTKLFKFIQQNYSTKLNQIFT